MKKGILSLMLIFGGSILSTLASPMPVTINSADTVVFDLSQATCTGTYVQIPVSILSDDTVYTLDFSLRYDHAKLTYDSIADHKAYLNQSSYYNPPDSTLRFTSWSLLQIENNTPLVSIYFNLLSGQISASYLSSINVFLNGDACSVKVIDAVSSSGIAAGGPTSFANGDSVLLSAPVGTGFSYLWSTGATTQSIYARTTSIFSVTVTNLNGCSTSYLMSINANSILPVELLNFNAAKDEEGILVSWATASEINNDYFTVERSADGINFESIKELKGAGNSTATLNYHFQDVNPFAGTSYYRLMQTDYDQKTTLSKTVAVNSYNNKTSMINIYPNPASDIVYVNVSWESMLKTGVNEADFMLRIFDVNGREAMPVQVIHLSYGMLHPLEVGNLPKGVYIVQISNDSHMQQQELVVR